MSTSVLITGGSEGIGRGLAQRYVAHGATVLVTGRSQEKLARVARDVGVRTFASDISSAADREALVRHVRETMPALDTVINNAGIQRRVSFAADHSPWSERQHEIDTLLAGPLHLADLLVPLLARQRPSTLVNVTSGGAYVPQVFAPVYSACKAALHSATTTLRDALKHTSVRVLELVPPAVQTQLASGNTAHGVPVDAFCDAVFPLLVRGDQPIIGFGLTANIASASSAELEAAFAASAARFDVQRY